MRRLLNAAAVMLAIITTAAVSHAGIDEVYTKPPDKLTWGKIFEWATGFRSFEKSYALVIGISDYTGGFDPLLATKNDPIRVKDFLLKEAGFDHVHVLTDEKATPNRIRQLVEGEFSDLVGKNDRFLFYWSGHGTQIKDYEGRPLGYLPVARSTPGASWTMLSMDELARWDRRIKARHALFLLDACFSGLAGIQVQQSSPKDTAIDRLSEPAHHLISAGTGEQRTIAGSRWGGSIFTDAFLRAARGDADSETTYQKDGVVNLAELLEFIRRRIDEERRRANWDQSITPQWNHLRSNAGEFFFITGSKRNERAKEQGEATGEFDFGMPVVAQGHATQAAVRSSPRRLPRQLKPTDGTSQRTLSWSRTYRVSKDHLFYALTQMNDGSFVIAGHAEGDGLLIKVDGHGNLQWHRYYSSPKLHAWPHDYIGYRDLAGSSDGRVMAVGRGENGTVDWLTRPC